ncbi:thiamine-phosphate kinase [Pollutimonas thiosulfatoxidans]|uniref:Thiamine-monophosphate kinase n=1 Tax=Pollutimonas thiosulfatoxidans TaxID=2028345 RepID=A0A410GD18_9BURK|nr:thiamine-phosphate kinase [Pollutimonas thiosulfatoxidans]QAA94154.1 thiamine-phosphate kinase [Pollutimonas thiosulfatoxidans]
MSARPRFRRPLAARPNPLDNEFDLIARYFSRPAPSGYLGVGDDCALLPLAGGRHLATSTDLLIEGRHFFADAQPEALGHKALAVNLSDLAAMGAQPLGCLLGLSLPAVDADWLEQFASGFHALADSAGCPLVGGDTTRSISGIVISVTVMGQVDARQALRRDAAMVDDDIWVTGALGAPDIALQLLNGTLPMDQSLLAATRPTLDRPEPPWQFAQKLPGLAHAALDISDGLLQDLGHILEASKCGAELHFASMPVHPALQALDTGTVQQAVLAGGDVYQLCFTAAADKRQAIQQLADDAGQPISRIGRIVKQAGLHVWSADGQTISLASRGYDHFS